MSKTYVIVGAGFRGFCDTLELLKGGDKVHIIDSAPFFGGVMYSLDIKGFAVDKGVHVFDSIPVDLAQIVDEIMAGKTRKIDFVSASAFNNVVTEGFSLPDLASLDDRTKSQIALELVRLATENKASAPEPKTLEGLLESRYGKTAGQIFCRIFQKVYGITAAEVEPTAIAQTSLGRLKFLDDAEMLVLKAHPWLDTVLAARRKTLGKVDDFVSIYPDTGEAMKGWCTRAAKWLEGKGVKISLGEKVLSIRDTVNGVTIKTDKQTIEADQVLWSNDNTTALSSALDFKENVSSYQYATPLLLVTLMTKADKIKDFTYLQNFDPSGLTYRTAAAGIFSNQITKDGVSFITCECPVRIGSPEWENPELLLAAIWDEVKKLGIVQANAELLDSSFTKVPVTFKLAKLGYNDRIGEFNGEVAKRSNRVILRNVIPFFRRDIYLDSLKLREVLG